MKVVQDVLRSQGQDKGHVKVVQDVLRGVKVKVRDMRRLFKMF